MNSGLGSINFSRINRGASLGSDQPMGVQTEKKDGFIMHQRMRQKMKNAYERGAQRHPL